MANDDQNIMPDVYDRLLGQLHGLPDTINTKMSSLRVVVPMVGDSRTFSVQTYRQKERGDTIFIETVGKGQTIRIALLPEVADTIARQRDQLTSRNRSKTAKATAQARKEAGILPGFMKTQSTTAASEIHRAVLLCGWRFGSVLLAMLGCSAVASSCGLSGTLLGRA